MYGALLTMTPPPRSEKPAWALAFKRRREEAVGSQEELAARADVSQSLISQIERGVQVPTGISMDRFGRLLDALNWSAAEFSEATGLEIPFVAPTRSGPPVPPRLPPVETLLEIPPGLQEAIERYSGVHPEFTVEKNLRVITSIHRYGGGGDFTPEEWLDILMANRRWLVKP